MTNTNKNAQELLNESSDEFLNETELTELNQLQASQNITKCLRALK